MENQSKTMYVSSILFESGDQEVTIYGDVMDGVFNYASEVILSFSQLNLLLNQLVELNEGFSIDDYLTVQSMGGDSKFFEADLTGLTQNGIDLNVLQWQSNLKQIRA